MTNVINYTISYSKKYQLCSRLASIIFCRTVTEKSLRRKPPLPKKGLISMVTIPLIAAGNCEILIICTDKHLPCCKPYQFQMVERRNALGSPFGIITVIKLTEHKNTANSREKRVIIWRISTVPFMSSEWTSMTSSKPQVSKSNSFAHKGWNYVKCGWSPSHMLFIYYNH